MQSRESAYEKRKVCIGSKGDNDTSLRPSSNNLDQTGRRSLQLILLLGLVSALGDVTYETGRSVSGPYLALLGASAVTVGWVAGLGEFIGYALRFVSGYLVDRTRLTWFLTFIGYGLILSIPLLAYVDRWEIAALLLLLERVGKAIRSPARDTILSYATHKTGRGWGFAIHEALDQVGAIIGPLVFAAAFAVRNSYRDGFSVLWVPAILMLVVLGVARLRVSAPEQLETEHVPANDSARVRPALPRIFWVYSLFTFFSVAGFANFQLISFHLIGQAVLPTVQIPLLYAVAMGVDALAALVVGRAYDRIGLRSLTMIPALTIILPVLVYSHRASLVISGIIIWGVVMATHETIMRASIADLIPIERRGTAYGLFNVIYGGTWFVGSLALGYLYQTSMLYLVIFVVIIELIALSVMINLHQRATKQRMGVE
jgi:MFS family permease